MSAVAKVLEVHFSLSDNETKCDVFIESSCADIKQGWREKSFPATNQLGKLKEYIKTFDKDHPKNWPMVPNKHDLTGISVKEP